MAGTVEGGRKAAVQNKMYDVDFYKNIGRKGGKISRGGGWTGDPEAARIAGTKGGATSRRGPVRPEVEHDPTPYTPTFLTRIKTRFSIK